MKKTILLLVLLAPLMILAQAATKLHSSGMTAQEAGFQRMQMERSMGHTHVTQNRTSKTEKIMPYNLVGLPMDSKWGRPKTDIPLYLDVSQIEKLGDGSEVYVVAARDRVFGEEFAEEVHMYFRNDSLVWARVPFDPHRLRDKATLALGRVEDETFKDDNGDIWHVWFKKGTAMAVVEGRSGGSIYYYPLKNGGRN